MYLATIKLNQRVLKISPICSYNGIQVDKYFWCWQQKTYYVRYYPNIWIDIFIVLQTVPLDLVKIPFNHAEDSHVLLSVNKCGFPCLAMVDVAFICHNYSYEVEWAPIQSTITMTNCMPPPGIEPTIARVNPACKTNVLTTAPWKLSQILFCDAPL